MIEIEKDGTGLVIRLRKDPDIVSGWTADAVYILGDEPRAALMRLRDAISAHLEEEAEMLQRANQEENRA